MAHQAFVHKNYTCAHCMSWFAQSHLAQVLQSISHSGTLLWQAQSRTSHFDKLEPFSGDYISCWCLYPCTIITETHSLQYTGEVLLKGKSTSFHVYLVNEV